MIEETDQYSNLYGVHLMADMGMYRANVRFIYPTNKDWTNHDNFIRLNRFWKDFFNSLKEYPKL